MTRPSNPNTQPYILILISLHSHRRVQAPLPCFFLGPRGEIALPLFFAPSSLRFIPFPRLSLFAALTCFLIAFSLPPCLLYCLMRFPLGPASSQDFALALRPAAPLPDCSAAATTLAQRARRSIGCCEVAASWPQAQAKASKALEVFAGTWTLATNPNGMTDRLKTHMFLRIIPWPCGRQSKTANVGNIHDSRHST